MREGPNRKRNRLKGYDYRQSGYYFLTLCEDNRQCFFGEVVDSQMILNEYGKIVSQQLLWMQKNFPYVKIDCWVVMPNHVHLIAIMENGLDDNLDPITGLNLTELNMNKTFPTNVGTGLDSLNQNNMCKNVVGINNREFDKTFQGGVGTGLDLS
jgi:hypothetical protein